MRAAFRLLSIVAAMSAFVAAPLVAHAADAPKAYTKEQIAQGKKEAPAVVASAGVACTVTDAAFKGLATPTGPDGKPGKGKRSVYEVACSEGLGYAVLTDAAGGKASAYDCLTTSSAAGGTLACQLPENANPKQGLTSLATAAGRTCTIVDARAMGATAAGQNFYELKCQQGSGFVIETAVAGSGAAPKAIDCAQLAGQSSACTLTTAEEIAAQQKAEVTALVAKAGRPCQVSASRSIGKLTNGQTAYEVACGPTGGFILMADQAGKVAQTVDCAKADSIAGGCTLTNAAEAKTAEAGTYSRLANASGFPCQVNKYRVIGMDAKTNSEVVELACANRPDGAIGMFPADNSRGRIYDCVQAGGLNQRCQFSSPTAVYSRYTQALAAKGRTSCKVSNARWLGHYAQTNSDLVETGCADGQPGYVLEVANGANPIKTLKSCGQAKAEAGVVCALPGNIH